MLIGFKIKDMLFVYFFFKKLKNNKKIALQ